MCYAADIGHCCYAHNQLFYFQYGSIILTGLLASIGVTLAARSYALLMHAIVTAGCSLYYQLHFIHFVLFCLLQENFVCGICVMSVCMVYTCL